MQAEPDTTRTKDSTLRYWLGIASKDHVALGVAGGFCQLCHGKKAPLRRMERGDYILYYSPKQEFRSRRPCQAITACGVVIGDEVYQYEMFPGFVPYRRDIEWQTQVREVPLDVLRTLPGWSEVAPKLRFGHVELSPELFQAIQEYMLSDDESAQASAPSQTRLMLP
ncbi:EVE domain-containing protein [uncultured Actinomyces sp.]|uniref:EVE domain-containing protein n=1 Tax=uncultured Actinomyces sp. TaxID=249061 RepID=UPI002804D55B|nr:EVE domain-containing protein [uncultured Actinomyces sp.]